MARPWIDLCTKNPPRANDHDERNTILYLSKIQTLIIFQHVQLGLISLIFLCSDIAYVLKQKQLRKRNKQTERNNCFRGTFISCWIIKHKITNWFLGRLFIFFPFCFSFFPFFLFSSFSFPFLFLFFFSFLAEYWGGLSHPCRPTCYAPAVHKIPQKMKMHWQNQLKLSELVWF